MLEHFQKTNVLLVLLVVLIGCVQTQTVQNQPATQTQTQDYNPTIVASDFVLQINNPFYTLTPGKSFRYQSETEEGTETNVVIVTNQTKSVLGVTTTVVWDRVWLNDELVEETYDWFAQDKQGNVWYFGEDSKEFENGVVVSTKGSWEAGVNDAKPGIVMKAAPMVGNSYRQEYYKGEAEDMADVVSLNETVTVPFGTFTNCLKTRDWSAIDPNLNEHKYYCREAGGLALEVDIDSGKRVELIPSEVEAVIESNSEIQNLEREISVLLTENFVVGPDHLLRLESQILQLEEDGADASQILALKQQLQTLKDRANEPTVSQDSATSVFRQDSEFVTEQEKQLLPSCDDALFSVLPVDLTKVFEITPLGNLGPPGHTFPTEHTFLHISGGGETTQTQALKAPADIFITNVSSLSGATQDPIDYTIFFALCKEVYGYFNHVKELSPQLTILLTDIDCQQFNTVTADSCSKILLQKMNAGTHLGEVGRLQGNFDFGLIDFRKPLTFANPSRYGTRSRYIQCPYDYFTPNLKQPFFDLIKRTTEPQCGQTAFDVPGTLKGNWFFENATANSPQGWDKYLAFVPDNEYPSISVISIGGTFTSAGKWHFNPKNTGTFNRTFEDITPNGTIYCFEAENTQKPNANIPSGKILVQLMSETELKIEHQNANCSQANAFENPFSFAR